MFSTLTTLSYFHVVFAIVLIIIVLLQDSKGGAMGMFGAGSSNTVFGSSGGANFLVKVTRTLAIMFSITCLALTYKTTNKSKSVIEDYVVPVQESTQLSAPKDDTEKTKDPSEKK